MTLPAARRLAFDVLSAYDTRGVLVIPDGPHISQLLDDRLSAVRLNPADRRLTTELVLGIVRRRATLDTILKGFVTRPREKVEAGLWRLMQLGVYQLVLLTSIPAHAAINETVSLADQIGKSQWKGFLNGVLRGVSREVTGEWADGPREDTVPMAEPRADDASENSICYRRFRSLLFPNPERDFTAYVAAAFSFPDWLINRWRARHGDDETLALANWFNTPGTPHLRVNPLRTSRDELLREFTTAGVDSQAGRLPGSIRLARSLRIDELPGFNQGHFSVQDESAQAAALLLAPQPGERILDLCAAPGGKSTHLAELLGGSGEVVACDVHEKRLELVAQSAARLGLANVVTRLVDPAGGGLPEGPFDAALVDVPCSNTGVLAKRPDVRWRITPTDLDELPALQLRLLSDAARLVRPGGRIVYSTCSVEPEENANVVRAAVAQERGLRLVREELHHPGRPADGGYQALLVKD
jgi:16S rRNA (cytosine967-C5)-methyltransferase